MNLAALQRRFQAHVLAHAPDIEHDLEAGVGATVERRLAVYAGGYRARLVEVLERDLPGLCAIAGAEQSEALLHAYLEQHPSRHFNIRWAGQHLADFLARAAPWSALPALAAMAAFEWTLTLAFDAEDRAVVAAGAVAALAPDAWPQMTMVLQPALHLLALEWNVAEIRRALDAGATPPALRSSEQPCTHVVWRRDFRVYHRALAADEAAALAVVLAGASFGEMCECLSAFQLPDAVAARAAGLLQLWLAEHWVTEVNVPD